MSSIQPSTQHSLVRYPYSCLTVSASAQLLLAALLLPSLVSGLDFRYTAVDGILPPVITYPLAFYNIPFVPLLVLFSLGSLLILFKKKIGITLSFTGLAGTTGYLIAYTQVMHNQLTVSNYTLELLLIPLILFPLFPLTLGLKKVKW